MKLNLKKSTIRKGYPVLCGLVVGGITGGVMQSIFHFLLFGGLAWWFFRNEMRDEVRFDGVVSNDYRHNDCTLEQDLDHLRGGMGFYTSSVDAMCSGAMFRMDGDHDNTGPGVYF
ncbi:MAG: hypothetical protein KBD60_10895 [Sterolibacterium sp.]|jgi:hypothetical protein|nr:hypothetical protein [Sterolibacterium sp.]